MTDYVTQKRESKLIEEARYECNGCKHKCHLMMIESAVDFDINNKLICHNSNMKWILNEWKRERAW